MSCSSSSSSGPPLLPGEVAAEKEQETPPNLKTDAPSETCSWFSCKHVIECLSVLLPILSASPILIPSLVCSTPGPLIKLSADQIPRRTFPVSHSCEAMPQLLLLSWHSSTRSKSPDKYQIEREGESVIWGWMEKTIKLLPIETVRNSIKVQLFLFLVFSNSNTHTN